MALIDTSVWKKFRLDSIFNMKNTKSVTQENVNPDSGTVPYVTAQKWNNGVLTYIDCPQEWIDDGDCIMIGGKTMTFSYQKEPFCSNDSHNIALYLKEKGQISENCYLFLITALRSALYSRYSWGDSVSMKRIKKEVFFLPVTADNKPDFAYMDSYMRKSLEKSERDLKNLERFDSSKTNIDIHTWKKFHLYDTELFDIDMGTKLDKVKMSQFKPAVNFVGRANANNGITERVDLIDDIKPYKAGNMTLSLGGEYLGSCFIQPDIFYTSQNVVVLLPKWDMPFSVKQFIATMIFRESRTYYKAFIDELNRHIKTDFSFYLPVTASGNPDFVYMDSYMRKIMKESKKKLENLVSI